MTVNLKRRNEIFAKYVELKDLQATADAMGLTRDHVRKMLKAAGVVTKAVSAAEAVPVDSLLPL
ncbi:hypothetical protein CPZ20_15650, partial [Lacticaseibacillus rhamnosus]